MAITVTMLLKTAIKAFFVCLVVVFANVGESASGHTAPAPAADCSSLVLNMADCLSYVTSGSTAQKPEGSCCSGLKTVLKTDAECLCEAFKNSAQLGVTLNVTKALSLPAACRVSAPSVSKCALSAVGGAPALSPAAALSPNAAAAVPTSVAGSNVVAPAPAPGSSGSSALTITLAPIAVIVASLAWF